MSTQLSRDARTGQALPTSMAATSPSELDAAVRSAHAAFDHWRASIGAQRAALLLGLAEALEADRASLVATADQETGLGLPRLNGELDRTAFQLRRFASLAANNAAFAFADDPAVPGAPPLGHPAMVRVAEPLGAVAMFSASNFPFAFSVLGGDTASALAAGCTVVVKAHSAHLLTSQRVHRLATAVLALQGLPCGLIEMVSGEGHAIGHSLITHPLIAAGAFTGSTRGGAALQAACNTRPRPIPFFGELGSINPVVATPAALQAGGQALAQILAASMTLGCGQFCTQPGLLVFQRSDASASFVDQLVAALQAQQPHTMLTAEMRTALDRGTAAQLSAGARALVHQPTPDLAPRPFLAEVDADTFLRHETFREEVFGPASLVVWTDSVAQSLTVLGAVGGSLTVTLWGAGDDTPDARALVRGAMAIAGRVLFAGVPTGVAVTAAQQHGGPWPASTAPQSTSVGDAALQRFLRPVAIQDAPAWLLAQHGRPC